MTLGQIYNAASTVMQQALSQIGGVGEVEIVGSSLPAVRVELNPLSLFKYGIGLEDVRAALASANAHAPKGMIEDGDRRLQIYTNDQANYAEDYRQLVIAYRYGAPLRLTEVAEVEDSVENVRTLGLANGTPSVLVILHRQPGANIIATVDRVKAALPKLEAAIPRAINAELTLDRTTTIRGSLREVERTLVIAVCLVILVVFLFLRSPRAALIPSVAVPVSLIGTFGVMYLLGYAIDRATAARLGLTVSQIDNTLYAAFGQRQVSVIFKAQNQYHIVMEVAPEFWQSPEILSQIYVSTGGGPVSGTQTSQPLAGTVVATQPPAKRTQLGEQCAGQYRS